jgi:hypothetical protein
MGAFYEFVLLHLPSWRTVYFKQKKSYWLDSLSRWWCWNVVFYAKFVHAAITGVLTFL